MRLSHPCTRRRWPRLAWLLGLTFIGGFSGCGPAPSDEASNLGATANVAGREDGREAVSLAPSLVVPEWMAKELDSPDAQIRLKAVDRWAQQVPTGSVDPLFQALEDTGPGTGAGLDCPGLGAGAGGRREVRREE